MLMEGGHDGAGGHEVSEIGSEGNHSGDGVLQPIAEITAEDAAAGRGSQSGAQTTDAAADEHEHDGNTHPGILGPCQGWRYFDGLPAHDKVGNRIEKPSFELDRHVRSSIGAELVKAFFLGNRLPIKHQLGAGDSTGRAKSDVLALHSGDAHGYIHGCRFAGGRRQGKLQKGNENGVTSVRRAKNFREKQIPRAISPRLSAAALGSE
jgi:hypothetical protein